MDSSAAAQHSAGRLWGARKHHSTLSWFGANLGGRATSGGQDHTWGTHKHTLPFPEPAPRPFAGVSRGFFQATNRQPCPAVLQLFVSKSSGVKKQEAMQRRERIQTEA